MQRKVTFIGLEGMLAYVQPLHGPSLLSARVLRTNCPAVFQGRLRNSYCLAMWRMRSCFEPYVVGVGLFEFDFPD